MEGTDSPAGWDPGVAQETEGTQEPASPGLDEESDAARPPCLIPHGLSLDSDSSQALSTRQGKEPLGLNSLLPSLVTSG